MGQVKKAIVTTGNHHGQGRPFGKAGRAQKRPKRDASLFRDTAIHWQCGNLLPGSQL